MGLIAQNVDKVFPRAVSEKLSPEDKLYVDYSMINIYLVEALKELNQKNKKIDNALEEENQKFNTLQTLLQKK